MYNAPLKELRFVLHQLIGDERLTRCQALAEYSAEFADSVLEEAAKFAGERARIRSIAPAIVKGAQMDAGRRRHAGGVQGRVRAVRRRRLAAAARRVGAWRAGRADRARHGGRGAVGVGESRVQAVSDADAGRDRSASSAAASEEQKRKYLPKMVSGEWTGTMNLTEPQAGTDLGAIRTRAVPRGRSLPSVRSEDLHHLRRSRLHAEHHSHGARAHRRRAGGHQRHLAVHRAEGAGQR